MVHAGDKLYANIRHPTKNINKDKASIKADDTVSNFDLGTRNENQRITIKEEHRERTGYREQWD